MSLHKITLSVPDDIWFKFRKRYPFCGSRLFSRVIQRCLDDPEFFSSVFFGED